MVAIRKLVNQFIVNDVDWVHFTGDSEYVDDEGQDRLGYWGFIDATEISDDKASEYYNLDDELTDFELMGRKIVDVVNDNGYLCKIQFTYY